MNNSMQRSALVIAIARWVGVKWKETGRPSCFSPPERRKTSADAEPRYALWDCLTHNFSETGFEQLIAFSGIAVARTSGACRGTLSTSARHAVRSHVRCGRYSSHRRYRYGV